MFDLEIGKKALRGSFQKAKLFLFPSSEKQPIKKILVLINVNASCFFFFNKEHAQSINDFLYKRGISGV